MNRMHSPVALIIRELQHHRAGNSLTWKTLVLSRNITRSRVRKFDDVGELEDPPGCSIYLARYGVISPFSLNRPGNYLSRRRKFRESKMRKIWRTTMRMTRMTPWIIWRVHVPRWIISSSPGVVARTSSASYEICQSRRGAARKRDESRGRRRRVEKKARKNTRSGGRGRGERGRCPGEKLRKMRKEGKDVYPDGQGNGKERKKGWDTRSSEARRAWK